MDALHLLSIIFHEDTYERISLLCVMLLRLYLYICTSYIVICNWVYINQYHPSFSYTMQQQQDSLISFLHGHSRYMCNFSLEDKTNMVPYDMQALLKYTQKNKQKILRNKKQKTKIVLEYESFPMTKSTCSKASCIGKTLSSNSVKQGCQCYFVAKKPYLDHSLCLLIHENT